MWIYCSPTIPSFVSLTIVYGFVFSLSLTPQTSLSSSFRLNVSPGLQITEAWNAGALFLLLRTRRLWWCSVSPSVTCRVARGQQFHTHMIHTGKVLHHSFQKCISLFTLGAFHVHSDTLVRADTWRHLMTISVDSSPTQHFMFTKHRQITCRTVRTLSHLSSLDTWPSDFWSTSRPWHLTSCTSPLTLMTWTERAACVGVRCPLSLLWDPGWQPQGGADRSGVHVTNILCWALCRPR